MTLTIVLLSLAAFASSASMRVTDAMLPRIAAQFQVGLAQAASVITVFAVAYGVMQVVFGPLGDRFGKLRVIGWACVVAAAATFLCLAAPGFHSFVAGRLLSGGFCGCIIPLAMAWIGDVVPYRERQPVIARFLLGQILGLGAGSAVGGVAAEQVAWRWPFAVLAVWLLASAVLLLRQARTDPAPRRIAEQHFLHDVAYVLRRPWARVVISTVSLEGLVVFGALAFVPTYLHFARGFPLSEAGFSMLTFAGGGVLFAVFARQVVRGLGEVALAVGGTFMLAAGFALIAWTPHALVAPVGCLCAGLGFYMLHNTLQTNATQMAPERRGAGMALFASTYYLGQSIGVAAAGFMAEATSALFVLAFTALAILPIGLNFARLRRGHVQA
ncbi:MAG TPA: MFS transporter [Usitatibacter sp.]|nr:MFS transporter [Usitatibacter sp.]